MDLLQQLTRLQREEKSATPIYMQLYRRFRDAIASGTLRPGERVPSVRSLASELNLARGTVELAYQILASEGFLIARGPAGTIVSPQLAHKRVPEQVTGAAKKSKEPLSISAHTSLKAAGQEIALPPFRMGVPALDAFPRKTWARVANAGATRWNVDSMTYPDPVGGEPLRRAIASYLGVSRGVSCSHDQVFVTAGYRGALQLVCAALLKRGNVGWFEDPGYIFAAQYLRGAGMQLAPVPVDADGMQVAVGMKKAANARFAVVTPTHQSPMGVALSLPRRLELLEWARKRKAWIIEDDYDSEFRYVGRPLPALKSLDKDARVLYAGTFSKSLFPGLCLGYLVVPEVLVDRFVSAAHQLPGPVPMQVQTSVAQFMEQGHFARHLRKMRTLYAQRRRFLVDALEEVFAGALHVQPQAGGIHVLAHVKDGRNDRQLARAAQAHGLGVLALGEWQISSRRKSGLLMGFTNIPDAATALAQVRRLKSAIESPENP